MITRVYIIELVFIKKCSHTNLRLFSKLQETWYYKGFISNIIQRQFFFLKHV